MSEENPLGARRQALEELLSRDRRYSWEAYRFLLESLAYGHEHLGLGAEAGEEGAGRHVTGQELCEAIRQYALRQFGYLAKTVLEQWGVRSTSDFGEMVYNLISVGEMSKSPRDRRADFDDVYDFEQAFVANFEITPSE